jgi:hypothetical protein
MEADVESPAGNGWRLQTIVPDGIFTLAIESDEAAAAAEHAAFADRALPVIAAQQPDADLGSLRESVIAQLASLRRMVAETGLSYLGVVAGELKGRAALILLSIAASPMQFPSAIDPVSMLASILTHKYPGAAVEEFATAGGLAVGIRRCDEIFLPVSGIARSAGVDEATLAAAAGSDEVRLDTGVSQALVPFPEAGMLASITGYCLNANDVDVATVFTAIIAYRMTAVSD